MRPEAACTAAACGLFGAVTQARLVGPNQVLLNERKEIALESAYGRAFAPDDASNRYLVLPPAVHLPGNWASLVTSWCPNDAPPLFSHWILDALPRLSLLAEFPTDTGILVPARLAGYQKESLALLGLDQRIRHSPERHLTIENYYFSSPTTMISCNNPYGLRCLREAFLPKADPDYRGPRRFLSQRKGKSRCIQNETEVNDYFRRRGWETIDTEKLTFAQEIKLFSEAEAVAGILGSGFTNCVWCRPGCAVITLVADSWLDSWVEANELVLDLPYHFAIFPSDYSMMARVETPSLEKLLAAAGLD